MSGFIDFYDNKSSLVNKQISNNCKPDMKIDGTEHFLINLSNANSESEKTITFQEIATLTKYCGNLMLLNTHMILIGNFNVFSIASLEVKNS